jgi:hypothetical protein
MLKIGVHDASERTQTLESVPLSLLFYRALFSRVLAVGDVLAQTLASSTGLGEPNPDAVLPSRGRSNPNSGPRPF